MQPNRHLKKVNARDASERSDASGCNGADNQAGMKTAEKLKSRERPGPKLDQTSNQVLDLQVTSGPCKANPGITARAL